MGLGDFSESGDEESSSNQSTYVTFKNPRTADISDSSAHRHKQPYYDAVKSLRDKLGQDINVVMGEFAVAADEADEGNTEKLEELFDRLAN
jgi:hypothetical protein